MNLKRKRFPALRQESPQVLPLNWLKEITVPFMTI